MTTVIKTSMLALIAAFFLTSRKEYKKNFNAQSLEKDYLFYS